jgi:hypothetical protein
MFRKTLISLSLLFLAMAPAFAEVDEDCQDLDGDWHQSGEVLDCALVSEGYLAGASATCEIDEGWNTSDCQAAEEQDCQDIDEKWYANGKTVSCSKVDAQYSAGNAICASKAWSISDCGIARPPALIGGSLLPGTGNAQEALRNDSSLWLQNIFLNKLINILIGLTAAIAVVFIIFGGYQYMTAMGNEEQIKKGHKTMTWGMMGVMLALLSFAIVQVIVNINFDVVPDVVPADILSESASQSVGKIVPFYNDTWDAEQAAEVAALPKSEVKEEFLPVVARFLIYGMAFVAFLVFFTAGAWLVLGWGEEAEVKRSKNMITWAVAGLAYAAVSYLLVKGLLGLDLSW